MFFGAHISSLELAILQAMIIIAWKGISPIDIFQKDVLYHLSSIFITAAFLRLLQSMMFFLQPQHP